MATVEEFETLDDEVRELIQNYKHKRATAYEPCTLNNIKECLIGLSEEFGLLNINYIFNPHLDVINNTIRCEAVVNLINAVWTLLQTYKNVSEKAANLEEQNHILDHNNKQLNGLVGRLKDKISLEKNESKACVASAQRISDQSDTMLHKLTDMRAKLLQVTKQKEANERQLHNEITRLKLQNEKLTDRLRNKDVHSHPNNASHAACKTLKSEQEDYTKHLKKVISKLENNNQMLLQEVLKLKEELLFRGMDQFTLDLDNGKNK
ncbi:uncharacterized protein LOC118262410 isoform X1 [Spodoptera frugiperda]|uniref:Uncharacterized protein LOC118262410 isoform X1 n=1 Tax=Spodoptera frugiperda TaxID=7108 RepID=A0A9R0EF43_SPOFR|nr:uncharacterized protein LOC118262410 isoform X1 [Spodoptera frugiperda]